MNNIPIPPRYSDLSGRPPDVITQIRLAVENQFAGQTPTPELIINTIGRLVFKSLEDARLGQRMVAEMQSRQFRSQLVQLVFDAIQFHPAGPAESSCLIGDPGLWEGGDIGNAAPPADVALFNDMQTTGLGRPIVVTHDGYLLCGARRLWAAKGIGPQGFSRFGKQGRHWQVLVLPKKFDELSPEERTAIQRADQKVTSEEIAKSKPRPEWARPEAILPAQTGADLKPASPRRALVGTGA